MINKEDLIKGFSEKFNFEPTHLIDAGGRFEICGNHTDHNHGLCLVANCSLRVKAAISENNQDLINVYTVGYRSFLFKLNDLEAKDEERGSPLALCKGVVANLKKLGYKVRGFNAYIESEIPNGSGVSSSAAIESLFGYIISYLFNNGRISPLEIAKTGQYSENVYFYKPCGLLDQIGTSFNSANFIDFKNISNPRIETIPFELPVKLYLIKSLGNHAGLTPLYKAIPDSMYEVAHLLEGKEVLGDCNFDNDTYENIDALDIDEAKKRKAKHFFIESQNVIDARSAILNKDLDLFFEVIRRSQESSKNNLENTYVKGEYEGSPQNIIDDVNAFIKKDEGAIRIHGGGFKGTVLAFIKDEATTRFEKFLEENYKDRYFKVTISDKAVNFEKI